MTFPKESEQIKDIIIISVPESPTVEDTREKALDSLLLLRPICPERDSVKEAVLQSMNAGVRIIMITSDYFKTATVISKNTDGGGCLEVVVNKLVLINVNHQQYRMQDAPTMEMPNHQRQPQQESGPQEVTSKGTPHAPPLHQIPTHIADQSASVSSNIEGSPSAVRTVSVNSNCTGSPGSGEGLPSPSA
jgi:hypothetical protein